LNLVPVIYRLPVWPVHLLSGRFDFQMIESVSPRRKQGGFSAAL